MNHAEVAIITRFVKAMCPAQTIDDLTPDAWFKILHDLRLEDCETAIVALKRGNKPPPFIDVGDIRRMVREIRNDRIERGPEYEPESGLSLPEWRRRVADGDSFRELMPAAPERRPRDMRAIEGTFQEVK